MEVINMVVVIAVLVLTGAAITYFNRKDKNVEKISFKEALDLVDLPVITFQNGDRKLNFLLDTGSTSSHINKVLIDKKAIQFIPLNSSIDVLGMEGNARTVKMATINLGFNNKVFEETFLVNDLSAAFSSIKEEKGVILHGILGVSFFDKYKYIIDFNKYLAYSKK